MQTKQHAMKTRTFIQIETRITRDYLLWLKDFEQKMFKIFKICKFNKLELHVFNIFLFLEVLLFLCAIGIFETARVQIIF